MGFSIKLRKRLKKKKIIMGFQLLLSSFRSFKIKGKLHLNLITWNNHCASTRMESKWSNPKELKIPVPYGYIAAKAWGDEKCEPVLAMHGWQDNAGTFDKLIPLLQSELYIVAVDSPGHGWTSHKPKGNFYNYMETLVDIQRVIDHFKWETFSILGHSMGGTFGLLYSSIYPERIKNLVSIDIVKPPSGSTNKLPDEFRATVESLLSIEKKTSMPAPVYSYDDAVTRVVEGSYGQITEESAHVILKRGSVKSSCGKGVVFSRDVRVKVLEILQKLSHDDMKAYLGRLRCNLLIILGQQSITYKFPYSKLHDEFLKLYEEKCESFKLVEVEGTHFAHLNNPELVAPHIDSLFMEQSKKEKSIL